MDNTLHDILAEAGRKTAEAVARKLVIVDVDQRDGLTSLTLFVPGAAFDAMEKVSPRNLPEFMPIYLEHADGVLVQIWPDDFSRRVVWHTAKPGHLNG